MAKYLLMVLLFNTTAALAQIPDSVPPLASLADIGGYKLHYYQNGNGKHTIIFIAGSKAFSFDWFLVQDQVSKFAKTLSYDRPGLAWSDAGPMPRTFDQDAYELHRLLGKIHLKPPYILVGHSVGAIIARRYTKKYPNEVEGLVLVDPTSENTLLFMNDKVQRLADWATGKSLPAIKTRVDSLTKIPSDKELADFLKMAGMPTIEPPFNKLPEKIQKDRIWAMMQAKYMVADNGQYWADEFKKMITDKDSLGARPLIVLSSKQQFVPKSHVDSLRLQIEEDKERNQAALSKLSVNGRFIATEKSGHEIHLSEPELVTSAIKDVIEYTERKFALEMKPKEKRFYSLKKPASSID